MKAGRQNTILQLITEQDIETQNQLLEELAKRGIRSTQATLSRDIKDMRLVKELGEGGHYKYVASTKVENHESSQRLRKILKESAVSYEVAQNLLVLKTLPGLASAACSALDGMMDNIQGLVGTIAGDDTAFIAMKDNESALKLFNEIEHILLK